MANTKLIKMKSMKKLIFITLTLTAILFTSCKKDDDYTNPDNLFGTEWKSLDVDYSDVEFDLIKFNSKTDVEYLIQEKANNGGKLLTLGEGTYSISGNKINIDAGYDYEFSGTINGNSMTLDYYGKKKTFAIQ